MNDHGEDEGDEQKKPLASWFPLFGIRPDSIEVLLPKEAILRRYKKHHHPWSGKGSQVEVHIL